MPNRISSEMCKAARSLVRWTQQSLADKAGLSLETIKRLEKEPGPISTSLGTYDAVIAAFEKAKVEFIFERGEGVLRLKR